MHRLRFVNFPISEKCASSVLHTSLLSMLRHIRTFRHKAGRVRIAPKTQSSFDPFKKPKILGYDDLPDTQKEAMKQQALKDFDESFDKNPTMEIPSESSMIAYMKSEARRNRLNRDEIHENLLHFFEITKQARHAQLADPENATMFKRGNQDERSLFFDALEVLPTDHADIFSPEEYVQFFDLAKLGLVKDQVRDIMTVCQLFYPLNKFRLDPYNEMEYLQLLLDSDKPQRALRYQQARIHHPNQDVRGLRWYHEFGLVILLSLGRLVDANKEAEKIIEKFGWLESNLLVHLCKTATDSSTRERWIQQLLKQIEDREVIMTREPAVSLGNITFTNIITKPGGIKRPFCETEETLEKSLSAKTVSTANLNELAQFYMQKNLGVQQLVRHKVFRRLLLNDTDVGLMLASEAAQVAKKAKDPSKRSPEVAASAVSLFKSLAEECPALLKVPQFYTYWLNVLTYFDLPATRQLTSLMEENNIKHDSSHIVALASFYLKHDPVKAAELKNSKSSAIWGTFLRHYARTQNHDKFEEHLEEFLGLKIKASPSTISAILNYYHKQKEYRQMWTRFNQVMLNTYGPRDHLRTAASFSPELYRLLWRLLDEYYRAEGDQAKLGQPSTLHSVAGSTPRTDSVWNGEFDAENRRVWETVDKECAPAPRNLFLKMITEQNVTAVKLVDVVTVFLRSADFIGAVAVLRFYKEVVGYNLQSREAAKILGVLRRMNIEYLKTSNDLGNPVMDDNPLWMGLEIDFTMYFRQDEYGTVNELLNYWKEGKNLYIANETTVTHS